MSHDAMEKLLRTLLHPRMLMAVLAILQVYIGVTTLIWGASTVQHPRVWAVVALVSGLVALASVRWCASRFLVALAGTLLVVASLGRAVGIVETLLHDGILAAPVRASYSIAVAQYLTASYVTYVVWRRLVIPFSVLRRTERRKVPR